MSIIDIGLGAMVGLFVGVAFALVAAYILMGQEGRFHFRRVLKGKGMDLILFNPLSGKLSQAGIFWNGKNWVSDDKKAKGYYFGLDQLMINGDDAATVNTAKAYNSALKYRASWEGCKRGVVFGLQEMCFVYSPEFSALLTKSLKDDRREPDDVYDGIQFDPDEGFERKKKPAPVPKGDKGDVQMKQAVASKILGLFTEGIKEIHVVQPLDPDVLRQYMEGETPRRMQECHDNGHGEAVLEYTRPKKEMGGGLKLGIGVAIVVIVVAILIAVTQGDAVRAMIQGLMGKK